MAKLHKYPEVSSVMLKSVWSRMKKQRSSQSETVVDFIRRNRELYESSFGDIAVSLILQKKLMILMIGFLFSISVKYSISTGNIIFLLALIPVGFTAFFHPLMLRFFPGKHRYLILYVHIALYLCWCAFNQILLAKYYYPDPSQGRLVDIVPPDQFVMIVLLTQFLASFIATSPYFGRTLLLNGILLSLFTSAMVYVAHLKHTDIFRHALQGLGLGGAISFVMMTMYRYRVYFIAQEQTLHERAERIAAINADIFTMQNTIPACIIKIDKDQKIIYANKSEEYLAEPNLVGKDIKEFVSLIDVEGAVTLDTKEQFYQALLTSLGENFEVCFQLNVDKMLPEFAINGRQLAAKYGSHIDATGNVDYILITISDNTAKIQSEIQKADNEIILALVEHLPKVSGFIADAHFFVSKVDLALKNDHGKQEQRVELRRNLHTFKGLARTMGFAPLAVLLHEAENLVEDISKDATDNLVEKMTEIKAGIGRIKKVAEDKLQIKMDQNLVVLSFTEQQIIDAYQKMQLDSIILAQACHELKSSITFFESALRNQAKDQGKEPPRLIANGPDVYLLKEHAMAIESIFGHVLRNAVDHGIETPEERVPRKEAQGSVTVNVTLKNGFIFIRITDDGRGLALKRIREKAVAKGLITGSDSMDAYSTAKLIFLPSFTTQDNISETSGRGVGMDVVKACVEELGGRIDVEVYAEAQVAYAPWALIMELPESIMVNVRQPMQDPTGAYARPA
jgi:two-component sensor histidine kinase